MLLGLTNGDFALDWLEIECYLETERLFLESSITAQSNSMSSSSHSKRALLASSITFYICAEFCA